jgi:hypothetical protein
MRKGEITFFLRVLLEKALAVGRRDVDRRTPESRFFRIHIMDLIGK